MDRWMDVQMNRWICGWMDKRMKDKSHSLGLRSAVSFSASTLRALRRILPAALRGTWSMKRTPPRSFLWFATRPSSHCTISLSSAASLRAVVGLAAAVAAGAVAGAGDDDDNDSDDGDDCCCDDVGGADAVVVGAGGEGGGGGRKESTLLAPGAGTT